MKDWNKMSIDEHVDYLETKFRFNSTGTAKSVYELIRAYRKLSLKDTEHQKLLKIQKL